MKYKIALAALIALNSNAFSIDFDNDSLLQLIKERQSDFDSNYKEEQLDSMEFDYEEKSEDPAYSQNKSSFASFNKILFSVCKDPSISLELMNEDEISVQPDAIGFFANNSIKINESTFIGLSDKIKALSFLFILAKEKHKDEKAAYHTAFEQFKNQFGLSEEEANKELNLNFPEK